MKFALLGCDHESLEIARALRDARRNPLDDSAHRIVACYEIPESFRKPLQALVESAEFSDAWEDSLHGTVADAVIVAPRDRTERQVDQLRKLAQAIPIVLVQPACEAIVGFELDMIRSDTGLPIVPYVRGFGHPFLLTLRNLASGDDSRIGEVRQLVFANSAAGDERQDVLYHLARDTSLVRRAIGHLTDITATGVSTSGVSTSEPDYRSLSVHFSSEQGTSARWNLESSPDDKWGQLTLIGEHGRAILNLASTPDNWRLEIERNDGSSDEENATYAWPDDDLANLVSALQDPSLDLWLDACRDLEVADTVDYSLRRGRKVNLISDAPSEAGTFKGVMAASGCLLILLALLVVIGWSFVEGFRYPGQRNEWEKKRAALKRAGRDPNSVRSEDPPHLLLRIWPVYPLILFLGLQTFRSLAKPRERPGREDEPAPES